MRILNIFTLLVGLFTQVLLQAQSLNPSVISTRGNSSVSGDIHLDWVIGEPVVRTSTSGSILLTMGFLQPEPQTGTPVQAQINGNLSICEGGTLSLTADTVAGASYSWTGPNGYTASGQQISRLNFTPSDSGFYVLVVTHPQNGSGTDSVRIQLSLPPFQVTLSPSGTIQVCPSNPQVITASGGNSYTWSTSATAQTIAVSTAGTFGVVARNGNGCFSVSSPVTVTLITAPPAPVIAGSNTVGYNQSLSLTATGAGTITWWSALTGGIQIGSGTSLNTGNLVQDSTYYAEQDISGCVSSRASHAVQVFKPIYSNTPVCSGAALYLYARNTLPFGQHYWTGPSGYSSSLREPGFSNANVTHTGYYALRVDSANTTIFHDSIYVVVNQNPTGSVLTTNSPVCAGNNLTLSVSFLSTATYLWSGPNAYTSSFNADTLVSVTTLQKGLYNVVINVPGCSPFSRSTSVVVNGINPPAPSSNSPVCVGNALYLTSQSQGSGSSISWTGPNGFVSSLTNPSLSNVQLNRGGLYTISVSMPGCGTTTQTHLVTVNTALGAVTATSNSPICAGSTLQLSANGNTQATYTWSGPNGYTSSTQFPIISNASALDRGIYTVAAQIPGCPIVTRTVNALVNSSPLIAAGSNSPICRGALLTLTTTAVSGVTYQWNGPNSYVNNTANPVLTNVQPLQSGIYTLTATSPSCPSSSQTISVLVGGSITSVAVTASPSPVCEGSTLTLNGTLISNATLSWLGPNGFTASGNAPQINAITTAGAGQYTYTVVSPGCGTAVRQLNVAVNGTSSLTASAFANPACTGQPIYFSTIAPSGTTYSWSGPSGFASTLQNPSRNNIRLLDAGNYSLTANVPGCGSVLRVVTLVVNSCRNGDFENAENVESPLLAPWANQCALYPNPAETFVNVVLNNHAELTNLQVLDMLGKEIEVPVIYTLDQGNHLWRLELDGLSRGVYQVILTNASGQHTERLLIK
jgi:hypothetical protein